MGAKKNAPARNAAVPSNLGWKKHPLGALGGPREPRGSRPAGRNFDGFFTFSKMSQNVIKRALGALGGPGGPIFPIFPPILGPLGGPWGAPYFPYLGLLRCGEAPPVQFTLVTMVVVAVGLAPTWKTRSILANTILCKLGGSVYT